MLSELHRSVPDENEFDSDVIFDNAFSVDTRLNIADVLGESGKAKCWRLTQLMLKCSTSSLSTRAMCGS